MYRQRIIWKESGSEKKQQKKVQIAYQPLAQGEYNINYWFVHPLTGKKLVLRVNTGSQMHLEKQIEYEYHALELLTGFQGGHRCRFL